MISLAGTKTEIAAKIESQAPGSRCFMEAVLDELEKNRQILGRKEYVIVSEAGGASGSSLVNQEKNYTINISSLTFLLASIGVILAGLNNNQAVLLEIPLQIIEHAFPEAKSSASIFRKLDWSQGETCILYEAAKNKSRGIDKEHFHRECFNCHLSCGLRQDTLCGIQTEHLENLTENNILKKKRGKYYYTDWI